MWGAVHTCVHQEELLSRYLAHAVCPGPWSQRSRYTLRNRISKWAQSPAMIGSPGEKILGSRAIYFDPCFFLPRFRVTSEPGTKKFPSHQLPTAPDPVRGTRVLETLMDNICQVFKDCLLPQDCRNVSLKPCGPGLRPQKSQLGSVTSPLSSERPVLPPSSSLSPCPPSAQDFT